MAQIEETIAFARKDAQRIFNATSGIRVVHEAGRPNSSDESTSEGVLRALGIILNCAPVSEATPKSA